MTTAAPPPRSTSEGMAMFLSGFVALAAIASAIFAGMLLTSLSGSAADRADIPSVLVFAASGGLLGMLSFVTATLIGTRASVARTFALACAAHTALHHAAIAIAFIAMGVGWWHPPTGGGTDWLYVPFEVVLEAGILAVAVVALTIGVAHASALVAFARARAS